MTDWLLKLGPIIHRLVFFRELENISSSTSSPSQAPYPAPAPAPSLITNRNSQYYSRTIQLSNYSTTIQNYYLHLLQPQPQPQPHLYQHMRQYHHQVQYVHRDQSINQRIPLPPYQNNHIIFSNYQYCHLGQFFHQRRPSPPPSPPPYNIEDNLPLPTTTIHHRAQSPGPPPVLTPHYPEPFFPPYHQVPQSVLQEPQDHSIPARTLSRPYSFLLASDNSDSETHEPEGCYFQLLTDNSDSETDEPQEYYFRLVSDNYDYANDEEFIDLNLSVSELNPVSIPELEPSLIYDNSEDCDFDLEVVKWIPRIFYSVLPYLLM